MLNEFKLTVVHVAQPKNPKPMQICACAWSYHWTKNCGKSGLGRGPPGRRGPWAAGRRAFGPLGRGGPWAAGLLLAKPLCRCLQFSSVYLATIHDYEIQH